MPYARLACCSGSTPRPRLTPLVRLPEKGSSTMSPAPGPAEATAFEPAFSDEDEEDGQRTPAAAVATAEGQGADVGASTEETSSGGADGITGDTCRVLLFYPDISCRYTCAPYVHHRLPWSCLQNLFIL